jgi:transmembrane sensor
MIDHDEPLDDLKPLEREALARVRHLGSGRATAKDIEETKNWGRQSTAHADALAQASLFWDRLGAAGNNLVRRHGASVLPDMAPPRLQVTRRAMLGGAVAASAAAYFAMRPPMDLWPSVTDALADYRTAAGEQRKLVIEGGVQVVLNTQTSLNVRAAAEDADLLEIVNGEAAITADGPPNRTLLVIAGDGRITIRRARFNVRHDRSITCISCLDGDLQVERQAAGLTLKAGQQVTYAAVGLDRPVSIDPAEISAWQQGILIFHDTPLRTVIAELNRYRPGKILLVNAELGKRVVNGRFRADNLDSIMTMFQQAFDAKLTALPGGIALLS